MRSHDHHMTITGPRVTPHDHHMYITFQHHGSLRLIAHHSQRTLSCSVLGACSATMVHPVRPKVVPHGIKCEVTSVVKENWDVKLDHSHREVNEMTNWS